MHRTWRTLTWLQHILIVVLTVVCAVRAGTTGAPWVPQLVLSVALLLLYAVGVLRSWRSPSWVAGLTIIWAALVVVSAENVWIAFSLWLLAAHLLRLGWAIAYSLVVLGVVIAAPWASKGTITLPEVLGPLIGAAFALFVSRGQVQLVRDSLERQRLVDSLVAAQTETEALHAELVAAQREAGAQAERTRLSRDIHDTLAQGFSSIVLLARAGQARDEAALRELVHRIEQAASDGLADARRVVAALSPVELEGASLPAALRRLADALGEQTGIQAVLRAEGDVDAVPTAVEVALLRTAQGALANVRQHAQASRVVLSLLGTEDGVRLDIVDDGVGFDAATLVAAPGPAASGDSGSTGGYGLTASRARLRELGGTLEVESAPGQGTTVSATVPLTRGGRP